MHNVIVVDHPVIQTKLAEIRDASTNHAAFRALLEEIAMLMTYEVTRDWPTIEKSVQTPLEVTTARVLSRPVTLVPILRAGLGMTDGVLRVLPNARVGHVGLKRNEETLEAVNYYHKLPPDVAQSEVLLIDPMLATGGSARSAITFLREAGVRSMKFVCLVAAPEGIRSIHDLHPDVKIYCCAIDRQLNEKGYILPGLGDAGDRIFGT